MRGLQLSVLLRERVVPLLQLGVHLALHCQFLLEGLPQVLRGGAGGAESCAIREIEVGVLEGEVSRVIFIVEAAPQPR